MTTNPVKLLDIVTLTVDFPNYNLLRGQVGRVVEVLAARDCGNGEGTGYNG